MSLLLSCQGVAGGIISAFLVTLAFLMPFCHPLTMSKSHLWRNNDVSSRFERASASTTRKAISYPLIAGETYHRIGTHESEKMAKEPVPWNPLCLCLAMACWRRGGRGASVGAIWVQATAFGLGWANASSMSDSTPPLATVVQLPGGVTLTGTVDDEPVCVSSRSGKSTWKFPVCAEQVRQGGTNAWLAASGTVRFRLFAENSDRIPAYGERWQFSGYLAQSVFKQGRSAGKPGALFFTATARKAFYRAGSSGNPLVAACLEGRAWAGKLLAHGIEDCPEQVKILNSILLGYYSQIPRDLYQAFAKTGTLHVFAISGSHVVILGGAIIFMLAAFGLPRTRWVLLLGPLLILYTAMTGLQPSAVRACIMGIVYWMAPLIGRKPDIYTTLAVSAVLILAVHPGDLTNIGFILSFVAVLGLVLLCPVFLAPLRRCFAHDPLKLEPDARWQEILRGLWHVFADLLAVSTAAWLVTMPLTMWFFGNFSPIGLPCNLVVVPISSLVIITGVLSLTLGACFPFLADLFNHANLALIGLMTETARFGAAVPYGSITILPPPLWAMLVFYAGLLGARFVLAVMCKKPMTPASVEGES